MNSINLRDVALTTDGGGFPEITIDASCEILDAMRIPLNAEERFKIAGNVPYYGANGVQGYIDQFIFDEELILLAEDGGYFEEYDTRPIAYKIEGKSWVNNHAHILRSKNGYDLDFVFYSLQHKNIVAYIKGGTRSKLNQSELKEITFWDAPLPQQKKIAKILSTVDNLIEQTQALIDKYTAIKQGMMADLFTRGIDLSGTPENNPNHGQLRPSFKEAPELYKETELGWVPREWEVCTLKNRIGMEGFVQTGPFGSQLHSYDYVESGVPVIMPQDIIRGCVDLDKIAQITTKKANSLSRHLVKHNDVVFSRRGDLTRSASITRELGNVGYFCGTGCLLMRVPENIIHGGWFSILYPTRFIQAQIDGLAVGTTMPNLNSSILGKLKVAFPNFEEQKHMFDLLSSIDYKLSLFLDEVKKLQAQKKGLMQDLLTGKVRVNA